MEIERHKSKDLELLLFVIYIYVCVEFEFIKGQHKRETKWRVIQMGKPISR